MAERAVLIDRRTDGRYAVASSRWGGTDRALAAVCAGTTPRALPGVSWADRPAPAGFGTLLAAFDLLSTAVLYRVRRGETTVFRPLWFGLPLPTASPSPGVGALVAVGSLHDARKVRVGFRALKGTLADALTAGIIPVTAAPAVLRAAVARLDGRERYLAPPDLWGPEPLRTETRPDET